LTWIYNSLQLPPQPTATPTHATTQLFGLHANADISYYTSAAKALWAGLVDLQPRTGGVGSGGQSREELMGAVARDIKGRLPAPFDVALVRKAIGTPSPTQVGWFAVVPISD